jgi:hypothetical protein
MVRRNWEFHEDGMAVTYSGAKTLAILLATAAVAAITLGAPEASAATRRQAPTSQTYDGAPRKPENRVYQRGRTRVYVTRRSWLDAGTEVLPGERKFTDYAFPPGYNYGRTIDPRYINRAPLGDRWDTGIPTPFPLY